MILQRQNSDRLSNSRIRRLARKFLDFCSLAGLLAFSSFVSVATAESDLSGFWTARVTVSAMDITVSAPGADLIDQQGDSIFMLGTALCPEIEQTVELRRTAGNTFALTAPIECTLMGVKVLLDQYTLSFSGDRKFQGTASGHAVASSTTVRFDVTLEGEKQTTEPLSNNTTIQNLADKEGGSKIYQLSIPAGVESLEITTTGGNGDPDVDIFYGKPPFEHHSSDNGGTEESLTITKPQQGPWYLIVNATESYSDISLRIETATPSTNPPTPELMVNGSDNPVVLEQPETLMATVRLDPGSFNSQLADWWVAASTPFGWFHLDSSDWQWKPGLVVTYQGPLIEINPREVLSISNLPKGEYTIYFGVDTYPDGSISDSIVYDSVIVSVR